MKTPRILVAAGFGAALAFAGPAAAECQMDKTAAGATQKSNEIVAGAKTDPETGEKEAATGAAKPTENWFGCKPGSPDFDECKSKKGEEQKQKAESTADAKSDSENKEDKQAKSSASEDCPEDKKKG